MLNIEPQPHQRLFLECNGTEDKDPIRIVFFGGGAGGGKTFSILVDNLFGVHDPDYLSVFFRSTNVELETNLWPEAKKMYDPLLFDKDGKAIGKSHISEKSKTITFPSGAKSKFSYLQHDKDADAWYGAELCKIYIDEFQAHSEYAFDVLRSRNRSRANVTKGMRFTLNPRKDHFMYQWVRHFIEEETGFPIKELGGKTRYYVIKGGELFTSWDREELKTQTGKNPQTYTYIPATLTDNKVLQDMDPEYYDVLDSLPEQKRDQLLLGCWKDSEASGMYFQKEWLTSVNRIPNGCKIARGWDTAGGVPDPTRSYDPDFTVGIKMAKCPDGNFFIMGMERFRETMGVRDNRILSTAARDGKDCYIVMPQDAGAAGKFQYQDFAKKTIAKGFLCKGDPAPSSSSKLKRFEPFSVSCQNGIVYIVETTFTQESLKQLYNELEAFNGERSTRARRDDIPDACASAFNYLSQEEVIPSFSLPNLKQTNPFN
jgi:predicted phage terminase large subunit-like protein